MRIFCYRKEALKYDDFEYFVVRDQYDSETIIQY